MKPRLDLLLTHDQVVQDHLENALLSSGATILAARNLPEAMRSVCARWHELDLAVLDADTGSHGRGMLHAIRLSCEELPILVTISGDLFSAPPFLFSHRAAACLFKPFTADELELAVEQICKPERELSVA